MANCVSLHTSTSDTLSDRLFCILENRTLVGAGDRQVLTEGCESCHQNLMESADLSGSEPSIPVIRSSP